MNPSQPSGSGGWEQPANPAQQGGWEQPANAGTPQSPVWQGGQQPGWPQQPGSGEGTPPPPPDWGGAEFGHATWTQEPGGFAEVETKKANMPLIITLVVAVVVVVAGGGTGLFLYLNRGPGDPASFAQSVVQDVNQHNFTALRGELCQQNEATLRTQLNELQQFQKFDLTVGKVTTASNGQQASAVLSGTYSDGGATHSVNQQMVLQVQGKSWTVCELNQ